MITCTCQSEVSVGVELGEGGQGMVPVVPPVLLPLLLLPLSLLTPQYNFLHTHHKLLQQEHIMYLCHGLLSLSPEVLHLLQ